MYKSATAASEGGPLSASPDLRLVVPAVQPEAGAGFDRREAEAGPTAVSDDEFVRGLYEQHGARVLVFAAGLTRDWHWAEDIVQTTMFRAWQSRAKLAGASPTGVRGWLFTVAHRIFIDEHRARSARPVVLIDDYTHRPGARDDIDRLLSSMALTEALRELSEAHRQVIVQSFFWQFSVLESAEFLGIAVGTVKSRMHYALGVLRQAVEQWEAGTSVRATSNGRVPARGSARAPRPSLQRRWPAPRRADIAAPPAAAPARKLPSPASDPSGDSPPAPARRSRGTPRSRSCWRRTRARGPGS